MYRVGYLQFRPQFGQVEKNRQRVLALLDRAQADLIVLPELAFTGYHFASRGELAALAEDPAHSPTVDQLVALCRRLNLHLVTGFAERAGDALFNSALLLGPSGIEHVYRKLHLFNDEKKHFDAGDMPLTVQKVNGASIGMMVCFDWAFPEVARELALQGAEILCQPANLVLGYCQQAMLTRCLENHVFAVTANRTGADKRPHGSLRFTGRSQIAAPGGRLVRRAAMTREELYIAEIQPHEAQGKRITPANDLLGDRRPEFYPQSSRRLAQPRGSR
jgi:predicted amidohydrolase